MGLKVKKAQLFFNYILFFAAKFSGVLNNTAGIKGGYGGKGKSNVIITVFFETDVYIIKFVNKIENSGVFNGIVFNNFVELTFTISKSFANDAAVIKIGD